MIHSKKALFVSFKQYLYQISKDAILLLLCIAPVLCGLFIKFGIPLLQSILARYLGVTDILTPYYLLFDLMEAVLTPLLYCFASAYLILGEIDEGITKYMAVTPLGKKGYLESRLGIPTFLSFIVTIAVLTVFSLTDLSIGQKVVISLLASILGFIEALLVVAVSGNRVEGMAVSKLSGLLILGLPAPFFIFHKIQYLLFFLPSFWLAKLSVERNAIYFAVCILVSACWGGLLYRKFKKKII